MKAGVLKRHALVQVKGALRCDIAGFPAHLGAGPRSAVAGPCVVRLRPVPLSGCQEVRRGKSLDIVLSAKPS